MPIFFVFRATCDDEQHEGENDPIEGLACLSIDYEEIAIDVDDASGWNIDRRGRKAMCPKCVERHRLEAVEMNMRREKERQRLLALAEENKSAAIARGDTMAIEAAVREVDRLRSTRW